MFCLFCSRISSKDYTFIKNDILYPVDMIILDETTIKIWIYNSPYLYRIYMEAFMKIHKQICRPVSSYNNKKKIFHMISSTFNFEEMCFDRFLHFILSFSFVHCDYDYRGVGRSHVEDLPFYEWLVYACVSYMLYYYILVLFFSFLLFLLDSSYTILLVYYIPWVISIYLLNKCARSWAL